MRLTWHGVEVTEDNAADLVKVGIVDVEIHIETRWQCPGCGTAWSKRGKHIGQLKRCRRCGARFFLRNSE